MSGIMGYANAQRTLDYIRTITEFISQVSKIFHSFISCGVEQLYACMRIAARSLSIITNDKHNSRITL